MRSFVYVILMLVLLCSFSVNAESLRPNVIIVVWDCVRADRVSYLGYEKPTTPTLDRLAREGVGFTQARTQAPWTLPAVASLITGRYTWEHKAGLQGRDARNFDGLEDGLNLPAKGLPYLTDWMAKAGYDVATVSANTYIGPQFFETHAPPDPAMSTFWKAERVTDKGLARLDQAAENNQPLCLYLHYMDAHYTVWPPPEYRTMFLDEGLPEPDRSHIAWGLDMVDGKWPDEATVKAFYQVKAALYDSAIRYQDDQLARLVARTDMHESILIVVSDHGEEFWDHGELERKIYEDPREVSGLGHGHTLFEELIHVPMVLWGPGISGGLVDTQAQFTDVWPTLAGLLKLDPPDGLPGRNVLAEPDKKVVQFAGGIGYGQAKLSVVDWPWKCILSAGEQTLLFNLADDPAEKIDLTLQETAEVGRLTQLLNATAVVNPSGDTRVLDVDEKMVEQLKALGYL